MKAGKAVCSENVVLPEQLQESPFCAASPDIGEIKNSKLWYAAKRDVLEKALCDETNSDIRRRMVLVFKVKFEGIGQNQAARALNCTSSWGTKWIKRFAEHGVEGLKSIDRTEEILKNDPRGRTCTVARSEDRIRSSSSFSSALLTIPEATPDIYGKQLKYSTTLKRLESAYNILAGNKELLKKFLSAVEVNGNVKTNRLIKYCDKLTTVAK